MAPKPKTIPMTPSWSKKQLSVMAEIKTNLSRAKSGFNFDLPIADDNAVSDFNDQSILETLLSIPENKKISKSPWSDKKIKENNV